MLLVAERLPKCPADLAEHYSEKVWGRVHSICGVPDCTVERPSGHDVIGLEEVLEELDGPSFLWECVAFFPVVWRDLHGVPVSLPMGDESGHAGNFRVGSSVPEVEKEGPYGPVMAFAHYADGHEPSHRMKMGMGKRLSLRTVECPSTQDCRRYLGPHLVWDR